MRSSFLKLAGLLLCCVVACAEEATVKANEPPRIEAPANVEAREGQAVTVRVSANDPDDDILALSADPLPLNASFDPTAGALSWTPSYTAAGGEALLITFSADDGRTRTTATTRITVLDVNQPPTLSFQGATTVSETSSLEVVVTATDADTEDTVTVTAPTLPRGATFDGTTLRWTPDHDQAGVYKIPFIATDDHTLSLPATTTVELEITVVEMNRKPVIVTPPFNGPVYELSTVTFAIEALDPDEGQSLAFSLRPLVDWPETANARLVPGGALCDGSTADGCATFYWAIPELVRGTYELVARATDNGVPPFYDEKTQILEVKYQNLFPVLDPVPSASTFEGAKDFRLRLAGAPASPGEPDAAGESWQRLIYSFTSDPPLPGRAWITQEVEGGSDVGTFHWDVGCTAAGEYQVTFVATDDGWPARKASRTATLTVSEANCPPEFVHFSDGRSEARAPFAAAVPYSEIEDEPFNLVVTAADGDGTTALTYAAVGLPPGATFNAATRTLFWRPDCTASTLSPYDVTFTVSDGLSLTSQVVRLHVADVNCAPRITRLCGQAIEGSTGPVVCPATEGALLSFLAEGFDPDGDGLSWSFSSADKPPLDAFDPSSRTFSWRPSCSDGDNEFAATFTLTDDRTPARSTVREVRFPVAASDCLPELTSLTVTRDGVAGPTLSLVDSDAETALTINEASRVTLRIEGNSPEHGLLSFDAPGLPDFGNLLLEDTAATVVLSPSCTDKGSYSFAVVASDPTGADQLSIQLTVRETNCPPLFPSLPNQTIAEMRGELSFSVAATDPDGDTLTDYIIAQVQRDGVTITNAAAGATVGRATGLFSWTPGYDKQGAYRFRFRARDHSPVGSLDTTTDVFVTVVDTNETPQLSFAPPLIGPGSNTDEFRIAETTALSLDIVGEDSDGDALTDYQVAWTKNGFAVQPPLGAVFDAVNGALAWTPGYKDAGQYQVTVTLSDNHQPPPAKIVSRSATITVEDSDAFPVVTVSGGLTRTVAEGGVMNRITVTATDADSDPMAITVKWKNNTCGSTDAFIDVLGPMPGPASFAPFAHAAPPGSGAGATFDWSPSYKAADVRSAYCLLFTAYNTTHYVDQNVGAGVRSTAAYVDVTVAAVDTVPALTVTAPSNTVSEGSDLMPITALATDTDSDLVSIVLSAAPGDCDSLVGDGSTTLPAKVVWSMTPAAGLAQGALMWRPDYSQQGDWCFVFTPTDATPLSGTSGEKVRLTVRVLDVDTRGLVALTNIPDGQPIVAGQRYRGGVNRPRIQGLVHDAWETSATDNVKLYTTADCSGAPVARGRASSFEVDGLQTDALSDNSVTTFYARVTNAQGYTSECSSDFIVYEEDSYAEPPLLAGTIPPSPAYHNRPLIFGYAEAGSTVSIYNTKSCSGTILATGLASDFAQGLQLPRAGLAPLVDNTTNTFYARVVDAYGNLSACSSTVQPEGLTYANAPQWFMLDSNGAPSNRYNHGAVWTGSEMIVWGGWDPVSGATLSSGGRYNPVTDSWSALPDSAPTVGARQQHSAVWSGREMLVWGGVAGSHYNETAAPLSTGGAFDPALGAWREMATSANPLVPGSVEAPGGRYHHSTVWTGREMIVWGGVYPSALGYSNTNATVGLLGDGGRYDPTVDAWYPVASAGAPTARQHHVAVWTGREMIVWGGAPSYADPSRAFSDGARYDPRADTWRPMAPAPVARFLASAVWTGKEMLVFGGAGGGNTLHRYDPAADAWTEGSSVNAPLARVAAPAVWTGREMVVHGGCSAWAGPYTNCVPTYCLANWNYCPGNGASGESFTALATGGRYDPRTDTWTPTMTTSPPAPAIPEGRANHTLVWTGREVIVFGGEKAPLTSAANHGRLLYPPPALSYAVPTRPENVDAWSDLSPGDSRWLASTVWTGKEMIVWGGRNGWNNFLASGSRFNPTTGLWTAMAASPLVARESHSMIWTGREAIVYGGVGAVIYGDGARYDPSADAWTVISTAPRPTGYPSDGAPSARYGHTAVWTGRQMIVFGGYGGDYRGDGGMYDPCVNPGDPGGCVDAWTQLPTGGGARYGHTAVWTGSEMIVWGGYNGSRYLGDGSIFDGMAWTPVSSAGAPSARSNHTAVWTGREMVVWGGYNRTSIGYLNIVNTGGRFTPGLGGGSWQPTRVSALPASPPIFGGPTSDAAPAARLNHTAVWTGREMLVYGGEVQGGSVINTGGRYDPQQDVWRTMPTAPGGRTGHAAVWTGREMLMHGGRGDYGTFYSDTWRYGPLP